MWTAGNMEQLGHPSKGRSWAIDRILPGARDQPLTSGALAGACQRLHELRVYNRLTVVSQFPQYFYSAHSTPTVSRATHHTWLGIQCGCHNPSPQAVCPLIPCHLSPCVTTTPLIQATKVCTLYLQPNRGRVTT